jgi:hypothetical protein
VVVGRHVANAEMVADLKQSTIEEIVDSERQLFIDTDARYGKYYRDARACSVFLSRSIASVNHDRMMFARFHARLKKHHLLALLSTLRLHKVQSMMNLRQVLEAGTAAAFAIANPDLHHFADVDEAGILDPSQGLTRKRYAWLSKHYPAGSEAIKAKKELINNLTAHANIVSTDQVFRVSERGDMIDAPFFDVEDEYYVKADLWLMSSIAVELMDLFCGVNQGRGAIEFAPDFPAHLKVAVQRANALHAEITSTERYKRAMEKMQKRP